MVVPRGIRFGHDADLVQSLATIAALNPNLRGDDQKEKSLIRGLTTWLYESEAKTRLFEQGQRMKPEQWRVATSAARQEVRVERHLILRSGDLVLSGRVHYSALSS